MLSKQQYSEQAWAERLLGAREVRDHPLQRTARRRRPRVLKGARKRSDQIESILAGVFLTPWEEFVARPIARLFAPLRRAARRLFDSNPMTSQRKGTIGDGLVCALFPRVRVSPRRVLECTDRRLLLVYRHIEPTGVELAEVGWEIPLGHLRWIRQRRDSSSCFYEFGFADGSWASIELGPPQELEAVQGFLALFPNVHLPAEENPSKGLAKSLRQEWESRRAAV